MSSLGVVKDHGIDLLRAALTLYAVEAVSRPANRAAFVNVAHREVKVTRVLKQADLRDRAMLEVHVNDFKRDTAGARGDEDHERVALMQRPGSRGLASFNPGLHRSGKPK